MKKENNAIVVTSIIAGTIVLLALLGYLAVSGFSSANTVSGDGVASIKVTPDLVSVYFSVDTNGTTSKIATDSNSEIVDDLITELLKQGFERNQIQTISFNVYPDYVWNGQTRTSNGFKTSHSLRVKMSSEETSQLGDVIDAGVTAGAGVSYINFELSTELQNQYKADALKLAAEDAKIKAGAIAEGLGKRLGRLVSTSESSFNYYPWALYESAGTASTDASSIKSVTANIVPGEQEVSANVRATFKLI